MVLSNILHRTLFIKAEAYGTAFTLHVDGEEYLVTARHLLDESKPSFELKFYFKNQWHPLHVHVVGHGRGEIDISVLKMNQALTSPTLVVSPTNAEMVLGQDIYFLGFPYKMSSDVGDLLGGLPCAFAKKGTVSSLGWGDPQVLYIDAINNEGFSGGPLFFTPMKNPTEVRVAGVVSKFRVEHESVIDPNGNKTNQVVPYNTGFLVAYGIKHVLDIIAASKIAR